jgi:hypothetical protein
VVVDRTLYRMRAMAGQLRGFLRRSR